MKKQGRVKTKPKPLVEELSFGDEDDLFEDPTMKTKGEMDSDGQEPGPSCV